MSNITPIRGPMPQWGGGGWQGGQPNDGWEWNGSQWVWCGPPPCPPPQCGPPSPVSAVAQAQACYNQSQSLYNLVSQVVSDIFAKNPGIIPSPPPSAGSGPILGVTDGSDAQPGQVGEFVSASSSIPYTAYPTATQVVVSSIVLQPGDWDVWGLVTFTTNIGIAALYLSPQPAGLSNAMVAINAVSAPGVQTQEMISLTIPTARASVAVPTLLAFTFAIYQNLDAALPAGTATFNVEARRTR